jgi:hypothetical protein
VIVAARARARGFEFRSRLMGYRPPKRGPSWSCPEDCPGRINNGRRQAFERTLWRDFFDLGARASERAPLMQPGSAHSAESLDFLKQLATYFSEFLETGFHVSRGPSRKLASRRDGLLSSIPLDRYPEQQRAASSTGKGAGIIRRRLENGS